MVLVAMVTLLLAGCGGMHGYSLLNGFASDAIKMQSVVIGKTILEIIPDGSVGRYMYYVNQIHVNEALEIHPIGGHATYWESPNTKYKYYIIPISTFQKASGQHCREFVVRIRINGRIKDAFGTACRMPDGTWKIQ